MQRRPRQFNHSTQSPPLFRRTMKQPNQQRRRQHNQLKENDSRDNASTAKRQVTAKRNVAPDNAPEANGIKKEDANPMKKATDPDKPKYNPKLVCQICEYTGHSASDCRRRIPKESSSAYGKIPYATNSQDDNKARRQDLKRQQRPMNPMQAVAVEEEQISYSDEDINQGF